jgi:hypothetical protein
MAAGLALPALAETTVQPNVNSELAQLKTRIAQLEGAQQQSWLSERQAEQVKTLIRDVLSDADTRASLLQEGMTAGIDEKGKIFLKSADGSFNMNIGGQLQFRWIANFQNDDSASDGEDSGFQVRRTKLSFSGDATLGDRKWDYEVVLAADRTDGAVEVEDIAIGTELFDGVDVKFGKYKLPFLREELLSSKRQLAVERALVTEYFTLDRSEQLEFIVSPMDEIKWNISINDGADEEMSTVGSDPVEFALTSRIDAKIAGDWKQASDFVAWPEEEFALFIGGAIHWQTGDGSNGDNSSESSADYLGWTVDALMEVGGFALNGAIMGGQISSDEGDVDVADRDPMGYLVQGGYSITKQIQPFARWELIDDDDAATDDLQAVTVGVNYFWAKEKAKFTADVVWIYEGDTPTGNPFGNGSTSDGLGFAGDFATARDDSMFILRTQFQLLF